MRHSSKSLRLYPGRHLLSNALTISGGKQVKVPFRTSPLAGFEMLRQRRHIARSVERRAVREEEEEEEEGWGQVNMEENDLSSIARRWKERERG